MGGFYRLVLEIWFNTPSGIRYLLACLPAAVCLVIFLFTWDWCVLAGGAITTVIMLMFSNPSDSEKKGYHF